MASQIRLFISGGPDQEPARELLGRALAEFPVNVGWVIKRTPDRERIGLQDARPAGPETRRSVSPRWGLA